VALYWDLARKDEEGYYYIVDREKDMYISGGENIYPAEIEKALHTHPKIFDAGIVGVPDEKWGEVGKAFVVLKPGETMSNGEVFEFLKERWPNTRFQNMSNILKNFPRRQAARFKSSF